MPRFCCGNVIHQSNEAIGFPSIDMCPPYLQADTDGTTHGKCYRCSQGHDQVAATTSANTPQKKKDVMMKWGSQVLPKMKFGSGESYTSFRWMNILKLLSSNLLSNHLLLLDNCYCIHHLLFDPGSQYTHKPTHKPTASMYGICTYIYHLGVSKNRGTPILGNTHLKKTAVHVGRYTSPMGPWMDWDHPPQKSPFESIFFLRLGPGWTVGPMFSRFLGCIKTRKKKHL